jgi:tripartite-type tricarboxylate transporter receptor subunit TctC
MLGILAPQPAIEIASLRAEPAIGLFVPSGTPPEFGSAIQQDIARVLARPEFKAKMVELGALPGGDRLR